MISTSVPVTAIVPPELLWPKAREADLIPGPRLRSTRWQLGPSWLVGYHLHTRQGKTGQAPMGPAGEKWASHGYGKWWFNGGVMGFCRI